MTTSECGTPSQPDSLDLVYDDWEGLFEFVGPINQTIISSSGHCSSEEDLNLSVYVPSNQPVLVDEETFLSLHPADFESVEPNSGFLIENALQDFTIDSIKNNKDSFNKKFSSIFNNNNNLSDDEISNNLRNNLITDEYSNMNNGLKSNGNMSGFTADLCDNLSEQVCNNYLNILFILI